MYLSRIRIENFRNFSDFDVGLDGNVVFVGENRVGKSNLLYALRLVFDPNMPDSYRQLNLTDFWDGLDEITSESKISVSVEVKEFEDDPDILALLTDFRLNDDPHTARLTYELRPGDLLEGDPTTSDDFEFICFGGESEAKRFGHNLRRRIAMDILPALRDAEADLAVWKRSPLRPLVEEAFKDIDQDELEEISKSIEETTEKLAEFDEVKELQDQISTLFSEMSGPKQDVDPKLGFSPTDPKRLYRSIRLMIDSGERTISEASLGSANLVFLSLKSLEIKKLIEENRRDHTFLCIEEPEAHLHPHLQRSVYRHVFEAGDVDSLSILLTTHSPHIASVAPLRSIVLLKDTLDGTKGYSVEEIKLSSSEADDIARYLDVTRAEMLFARGVILVEGDAEKFLVPEFARVLGAPLDQVGVTICSVSGTNFKPYVKFLRGLGIPYSVITDWDPRAGKAALGYNRTMKLVECVETLRTGEYPEDLVEELGQLDEDDFCDRCEEFGIFTNYHTLEIDLFNDGFADAIISVLRERKNSPQRTEMINSWEEDNGTLDEKVLLSMIESVGKGRFAQRLASYVDEVDPPSYISKAINFVVERV